MIALLRTTCASEERAAALARQMVEELRVSVFAQQVRTAFPVSEQRIRKALDALTRTPG